MGAKQSLHASAYSPRFLLPADWMFSQPCVIQRCVLGRCNLLFFLNRNDEKAKQRIAQSLVKYIIGLFFFASFRKDYVSKCVDYVLNTSVKAVYEEFQRGFYKLFDKEILKHFKPEELMRAIIGNTDYDWEQFEKVGNN